MKPTTKVAIAATVLIAFGGLLAWVAPNGGTALADVAEALANVRTATWKTRIDNKPENGVWSSQTAKSMYLAPSRERHEFPGAVSIVDVESGKEIVLLLTAKKAAVHEWGDGRHNSLERFRRMIDQANESEKLGRQTIDGRETMAFRIDEGDTEHKLWADPETGLPVRVESTSPKGRVLFSDFRYNVDLDELLFSLEVPDAYTMRERGGRRSTSRASTSRAKD